MSALHAVQVNLRVQAMASDMVKRQLQLLARHRQKDHAFQRWPFLSSTAFNGCKSLAPGQGQLHSA